MWIFVDWLPSSVSQSKLTKLSIDFYLANSYMPCYYPSVWDAVTVQVSCVSQHVHGLQLLGTALRCLLLCSLMKQCINWCWRIFSGAMNFIVLHGINLGPWFLSLLVHRVFILFLVYRRQEDRRQVIFSSSTMKFLCTPRTVCSCCTLTQKWWATPTSSNTHGSNEANDPNSTSEIWPVWWFWGIVHMMQ